MRKLLTAFIFAAISCVLISVLCGCGLIAGKISENIAEGMAEKALGGDSADVDIDGDKIVIKGEDGQEVNIGGTEWPDSEAAKKIPKLEAGKVESVMSSDDYVMINVTEVTKDDYSGYVQKLKDKGFTENTFSMDTEDSLMYSGNDADGFYASVIFDIGSETISITAGNGNS